MEGGEDLILRVHSVPLGVYVGTRSRLYISLNFLKILLLPPIVQRQNKKNSFLQPEPKHKCVLVVSKPDKLLICWIGGTKFLQKAGRFRGTSPFGSASSDCPEDSGFGWNTHKLDSHYLAIT